MVNEKMTLLSSIQNTMLVRSTASDLDAAGQADLRRNARLIGGVIEELRRYHALLYAANLAILYDGGPAPLPVEELMNEYQRSDGNSRLDDASRGDSGTGDLGRATS